MPIKNTNDRQLHKPDCLERVTIDFIKGCKAGIIIGLVLSGLAPFQDGLRGRQLLWPVAKSMVSNGGMCGIPFAMGSAINCS